MTTSGTTTKTIFIYMLSVHFETYQMFMIILRYIIKTCKTQSKYNPISKEVEMLFKM